MNAIEQARLIVAALADLERRRQRANEAYGDDRGEHYRSMIPKNFGMADDLRTLSLAVIQELASPAPYSKEKA